MEKRSRIVHLTHADLDGLACAVLLQNFNGLRSPNLIYEPYFLALGEREEVVKELEEVGQTFPLLIITDLVFAPSQIERMKACTNRLILIDHHLESDLIEGIEKIYNPEQSAALLTWGWLRSEVRNQHEESFLAYYFRFAEAVNAWDMWEKDSARLAGERLNRLCRFFGPELFLQRGLPIEDSAGVHDYEWPLLDAMNRQEEKYIHDALGRCIVQQDQGSMPFVYCVASQYISTLGNRMLSAFGVDCSVIYNVEGDRLHVRTAKESSLSAAKIAESFGGGGHQNSAGAKNVFTLEMSADGSGELILKAAFPELGEELVKR